MTQQREHWGSRFGFVMAAAGSAIGLGSLWKFPYEVGANGGGAFVILFIIFTAFIALPIFTAELILGRRSQKGPIFAYQHFTKPGSNWKMLGWLNLISCFLILAYYSVVAGWCLSYTLMSLNQFYIGKTPEQIKQVFTILYESPSINLLWLAIFILINIGVIYSGVRKGIEHWSKILTPGFFIILLGLFFYSCTLDGFSEAISFIFKPNFSELSPSSVLNALGMAFFILSAGLGIILTYGSYMKPDEDIPKTGLMVATTTVLVSLIGACMIFPIVFTFNFPPQGGPGLLFETMPVIFAQIPGSLVIATIFFALLLFVALTSSISLLETIVANIMELQNCSRSRATLIGAGLTFLIGIPCALSGSNAIFPSWEAIYGKNFFETIAYISSSWMMPIAGLLTTIFAGWILEKNSFQEELTKGSGRFAKLLTPWYFSIRWVAPIVVVIIILEQAGIIDVNAIASYFTTSR